MLVNPISPLRTPRFALGWTPLDLGSKLLSWNDAEFVTKDGSGFVSAFDDLAGNGIRLTQGVGTYQGQQGSDANGTFVQLDGIDDRYIADFQRETRDETYTYIIAPRTGTSTDFLTMGSGSNGARVYWDTSTRARNRHRRADTTYLTSTWWTTGGGMACWRTLTKNPTNQYGIHINGINYGTITVSAGGFYNDNNGSDTFGSAGLGSGTYDGRLYAMIVTNEALTTEEENSLYTYFNSRFGLSIVI